MSRLLLFVFLAFIFCFQTVTEGQLIRNGRVSQFGRFRVAISHRFAQPTMRNFPKRQIRSSDWSAPVDYAAPSNCVLTSGGFADRSVSNSYSSSDAAAMNDGAAGYQIPEPPISAYPDSVGPNSVGPRNSTYSGYYPSQIPAVHLGAENASSLQEFDSNSPAGIETFDEPGVIVPLDSNEIAPGAPQIETEVPAGFSDQASAKSIWSSVE